MEKTSEAWLAEESRDLGHWREELLAAACLSLGGPVSEDLSLCLNGRLRDECLNEHVFSNLNKARAIIEEWRIDYNTNRPHTSLNGLTPTEFAARPDQGHNRNKLYL